MRIIAGKFKGRVLNDFSHEGTRPTADKARGGIFNTIAFDIENCIFLDLFGGTGAVGIEAESRGADSVYIVDNNPKSIATIKENCKKCGTEKCKVILKDYAQALKEFSQKNIVFDIVFIDPPYKSDFGEISMDLLHKYSLINENSLICFEHDGTKKLDFADYELIKTRKYGIALVDYFTLKSVVEK